MDSRFLQRDGWFRPGRGRGSRPTARSRRSWWSLPGSAARSLRRGGSWEPRPLLSSPGMADRRGPRQGLVGTCTSQSCAAATGHTTSWAMRSPPAIFTAGAKVDERHTDLPMVTIDGTRTVQDRHLHDARAPSPALPDPRTGRNGGAGPVGTSVTWQYQHDPHRVGGGSKGPCPPRPGSYTPGRMASAAAAGRQCQPAPLREAVPVSETAKLSTVMDKTGLVAC